jgi:LAGLIDADG DNA endonuclease family
MNINKYSPVVKQISLSKDCVDFIIGTLFGDGHLSKPAKNARIQLTHGESQKFYIEHKAEILKDICPNGVVRKEIFDKRNGKYYPSYVLCTFTNEKLTELHKLFYPQNKKKISRETLKLLTPKSIAYWYMDDGGLGKFRHENGRVDVDLYLNTYMSDEEHRLIIEYFKNTYNIKFKVNKNHNMYRLRIGKKQAKQFIKIVEPYILEGFKYKINLL